MCNRGDLAGIQKLLGDRLISPFSVDEYGNTLLNHSARATQTELCKFFFKIGFTGEETNNYNDLVAPPVRLFDNNHPQWLIEYERTYDILSSHVDISDPSFYNHVLFQDKPWFIMPPDVFAKVVYGCCTKDNINASESSPLAVAAIGFMWSPLNLRYRWKSTIRHLISLEADIHQGFSKGEKTTILDDLLGGLVDPFRSRSIGQAWLDVLTESGIDVSKYLQTEYHLHFDPSTARPMLRKDYKSYYSYHYPRYLIISTETPSVSWDWFVDPEGQAYDVLEEFKNLPHGQCTAYCSIIPDMCWPFIYPRWQWSDERPWVLSHQIDFLLWHRANDRFKQRCERKAMKLAKTKGKIHQGPRMPGAWID